MKPKQYQAIGESSGSMTINKLRLVILVLALALAHPVRAAPLAAAPDMAAIDRFVAEQLHTLRIPGAAL
ncbi:MAG TPA: hypothetical protein VFU22_18540 [Roseiflexaceae bacterium]|nr:hypothetical protein [Roseiflexaceae bacterium]